jgi:fatty acid-binding protein DegV
MTDKLFPVSMRARDIVGLVVSILVYLVIGGAVTTVLGWLSGLLLICWIFRVVSGIVDLYCLCGIIVSVLVYLKIVK